MASDSYRTRKTFHDIEDPKLRAWNRVNMMFNLDEEMSSNQATLYLEQFNDKDRAAVLATLVAINKQGYDTVRRKLIRG